MPKYCHTCFCEFRKHVEICPKDKTKLSIDKPKISKIIFVDIFAVSNQIEAERTVFLLQENGIEAREHKFGISQLPVISDTDYVVCVKKDQINEAREIIKQAQKDQIISEYGKFVDL